VDADRAGAGVERIGGICPPRRGRRLRRALLGGPPRRPLRPPAPPGAGAPGRGVLFLAPPAAPEPRAARASPPPRGPRPPPRRGRPRLRRRARAPPPRDREAAPRQQGCLSDADDAPILIGKGLHDSRPNSTCGCQSQLVIFL